MNTEPKVSAVPPNGAADTSSQPVASSLRIVPCNSEITLRNNLSRSSCHLDSQSLPNLCFCPQTLITTEVTLKRVTRPQTCRNPLKSNVRSAAKKRPQTHAVDCRTSRQTIVPVTPPDPKPNWVQWRQIFRENGMIRAAMAISHKLCKHCDRLDRYDRLMNRQSGAASGPAQRSTEPDGYDGRALDAFTDRMLQLAQTQFGQWPRVYENMPQLQMAVEPAYNCGSDFELYW